MSEEKKAPAGGYPGKSKPKSKAKGKRRLSKKEHEAQKARRHEVNKGRKKQIRRGKRKAKADVLPNEVQDKIWELTMTMYDKYLPKELAPAAKRCLATLTRERARLLDERQYAFKMPRDADGVTIKLGDIVEGDDGPLWRVEGYGMGSHPIMVSGPLRADGTRRYVRMKPEWIRHVNDDRAMARTQRDLETRERIKADCDARGVEVPYRKFMGWHPTANHEGADDE